MSPYPRLLAPVLIAISFGCVGDNDPIGPAPNYPSLGREAIEPPTKGIIGLTFDDGPSAAYTPDILAVLARHHAKATFFVIGRNIPGNRDILAAEQRQGHQIGNHTYYHEAQPSLTQDVFNQRTLAVKANIGDYDGGRLYFRFPYGAAGPDQLQWLASLNVAGRHYLPVGWNFDTQDWEFGANYPTAPTSTSILEDAATCGQPNPFQHDLLGWTQFIARKVGGGVVLMHDIQRITHDNLDDILTGWETPSTYWASLSAAVRASYQAYYSCEKVDPNIAFQFQPLSSGTWPSLVER